MARHNDLGKWGEGLAVEWLAEKGFEILRTNWRHRRSEIDVIAMRNGIYHFIEVKYRESGKYGFPEERVSRSKIRNIMSGAVHWLYEQHVPAEKRVQYDVLAIRLTGQQPPEYLLIEDVSL